jgi:CRP-like cAMP-binding protein
LQRYEKGETLFWQGEPGTGFFLVRSGKVKVFQLSGGGKEQILGLFEAGDYFAEVPALDGGCFPASAETLETSAILFFPRAAFLDLLKPTTRDRD